MYSYVIQGGNVLNGEISASGSKNAALPLLAASILIGGKVKIKNIPRLKDISTMIELLTYIGADVNFESKNTIIIDTSAITEYEVPYDLVKKMRASFIIAGPLLSVFKKASVSLPGGCAIGTRPVDIHLKSFSKLGVIYFNEKGYINLRYEKVLKGKYEVMLDFPSVGATQNIIMFSVLGDFEVKISNPAKEPEIKTLIDFLNTAGADIKTDEHGDIVIKGVKELKKDFEFSNIPDRIEIGTFMVGAALTGGKVRINNVLKDHIKNISEKLKETGTFVEEGNDFVVVENKGEIKGINIKTQPHPGFPTDMQAQFCSLLSVAKGMSLVEETIFENRFMHIPELIRMGADIYIEKNIAFIKGVNALTGAPVMASDLRAGAALVLAGLAARGQTIVNRIYHIDRGYEDFEVKLQSLGASIERVKNS